MKSCDRRGWLTHEQFLDRLARIEFNPRAKLNRAGDSYRLPHGGSWRTPDRRRVLHPASVADCRNHCLHYIRFGHFTGVQGILYGVKPVVIAVVLQALWRLGRTAVKTRFLACMGIAAAMAKCAWRQVR